MFLKPIHYKIRYDVSILCSLEGINDKINDFLTLFEKLFNKTIYFNHKS